MNLLFWAGVVVGVCLVITLVWVMDIYEMKNSSPYKVAKFEKVSYGQFEKDWLSEFFPGFEDMNDEFKSSVIKNIEDMYEDLELPDRATSGSAGYDFHCPSDFVIQPGEVLKIPTGIRCSMKNDWVLKIYPRSSLGFKYLMRIANTVGIIDSDYYNSDNEGHIMIKIVNGGDKDIVLDSGNGFAQGIFVEYGVTYDDDATETRNGGFGSTGK